MLHGSRTNHRKISSKKKKNIGHDKKGDEEKEDITWFSNLHEPPVIVRLYGWGGSEGEGENNGDKTGGLMDVKAMEVEEWGSQEERMKAPKYERVRKRRGTMEEDW